MKIKTIVKWGLNLILFVFFIYVLFKIDFNVLREFFWKVPILVWILMPITYLISYMAKAIRFKILNNSIKFKDLLVVSIYHNFFLMLLPFKLGEVIYIKKLKEHNVKITKSLSDLVLFRVYDVLILLILAILLVSIKTSLYSTRVLVIIAVLFIISFLFIFKTNLISKIFKKFKPTNNKVSYLVQKITETVDHISTLEKKKKILLLPVSILVWAVSFSTWIILLGSLAPLSLTNTLIASLVTLVSTIIPLNLPGGIGLIQGGWVAGLYLAGSDTTFAFAFSVLANIVYILSVSLIFGLVILILRLIKIVKN